MTNFLEKPELFVQTFSISVSKRLQTVKMKATLLLSMAAIAKITYEISPRIIMHLQQMSSCYYMAESGFGCAFLRSATLQMVKKSDRLLFYFIDSSRSVRGTRLYCKKGGYMTKAMQAFLAWLPTHLHFT